MKNTDQKNKQTPQKLTHEQKINAFLSLYYTARKLKFAILKHKNPHLSDEKIKEEVTEIFKYANY